MAQNPARVIGQAIDLIVHIARRPAGRTVEPILVLDGVAPDGGYRLCEVA